MKFQDDILMPHTLTHTDKPKPICPPLFQSWGHNKFSTKECAGCQGGSWDHLHTNEHATAPGLHRKYNPVSI